MITRRGLLAALPFGGLMTQPPGRSWPLNQTGTVILDGSGKGTVQLTPDGPNEHWAAAIAAVKVSTKVAEAICLVYVGPSATDQYFVDASVGGSTGDNTDRVSGYDIWRAGPYSSVWAVWTGGDAGATATLIVTGTRSIR